MIELLLALSLTPLAAADTYEICVWPRTCSGKAQSVAQFQPCVWPNTCAKPVEAYA